MMNTLCNRCGKPACGCGCKPAEYGPYFDIQKDPFDPYKWLVNMNGASFKVNVPEIPETDTKLSADYDGAMLNYAAERHTDKISGHQLGQLVNVDDLRDTAIDDTLDGHCYEFIFRKWEGCGDGCQSLKNMWTNWNINSEGAKQNGIQYVRGANSYGCPVYLDVPTDTTTYWWGMWRPTDTGVGTEFGYIQPETVNELPKDSNGDSLVLSQDSNGKPIYGPIKYNVHADEDILCSEFIPATGFEIAEGGGNSICYNDRLKTLSITLDIWVTEAREAATEFDLHVATIKNSKLWPGFNYLDLPLHWVWSNNSDGAITPAMLRIDRDGRLLLSGYIPARTMTGKTRYEVIAVDDVIWWDANWS